METGKKPKKLNDLYEKFSSFRDYQKFDRFIVRHEEEGKKMRSLNNILKVYG